MLHATDTPFLYLTFGAPPGPRCRYGTKRDPELGSNRGTSGLLLDAVLYSPFISRK